MTSDQARSLADEPKPNASGATGTGGTAIAGAQPPWAAREQAVAAELGTDPVAGLSGRVAAERLAADGPNELEAAPPVPRWVRMARQFSDPLVVLLLVAIAISLMAWAVDGGGEIPLEAIVIAAIVVLNAAIGYWQEAKAIQAVEALRRLTGTLTTVVRDGEPRSILTAEVVRGDVVLLAEGDAVGADARLVDVAALRIVEAALTGESVPTEKTVAPIAPDAELVDRSNMVFNGTAVAGGRGRGVVVATGMATEIGRIATMLEQASDERTPLQRQIDWLGKMLGTTVVVLAAIVLGAIALTSDINNAGDLLDALLVGVSLAVAAVPEGLPAIVSVVLALGVQRMAAHNAVVKKLSSVETLGSASVICTDKTGTLTRNEMTIVRVATATAEVEITGSGYEPVGQVLQDGEPVTSRSVRNDVGLVLGAGSLANDASMRRDESGQWQVQGDPTEAAFLVAERKLGLSEQREQRYRRVGEIPFNSERKLMTTIDHDRVASNGADAPQLMLVTKGAPDVLIEHCTRIRIDGDVVAFTPDRRAAVEASIERLGDAALRTLAVAYRTLDVPPDELDESIERDLIHLGVVGIIDPPRPEAATAIAEAHRAGIRIMMITGDHPRTAARIGEQLGLDGGTTKALTGGDLAILDDEAFAERARTETVLARVAPEHKLRVVESLQAGGEIVAMTGDGVNDAPALKQADIGVAMGINGTEVSKEAADMILADDNFATILRAVREGREIFADIRKFLRYLLASNTGEVLVMFVGVLGAGLLGLTDTADGLAVPLLATQILWINLLTDSTMALALGVDPAVEDMMDRPPRRVGDRLVDNTMLVTIGVVGATIALAGLVALDLELRGGLLGGSGDLVTARTMVFTTLVLAQIFNAFNARSDRISAFVRPFDNRLLWAAVAVTVALQVLVVHAPALNRAFDTVPLDARRWAICLALSSSVLVVEEGRKLVVRARSS
ncbi:MAG: cation-translocating P-type ATPase [Acidimicrobiia bacterium]|nr:cation-translocating P-type ATPase [Acidimicrobiia bacterium]